MKTILARFLVGRTSIFLLGALIANPLEISAQTKPGELDRPRARDVGLKFGVLRPGVLNAITDVAGVRVGHKTIIKGDDIRTGVTAIIPHSGNVFQEKLPAAMWLGNGFGKLVGISQVQELGLIETPILLTNTLSTFRVADSLISWTLAQPGNEGVRSVNPVVGECNDGTLNNIRAQIVRRSDVEAAIDNAAGGKVAEGCVGAGTGTRCLGWKGGIGTSSRRLPNSLGGWTVGVLVQTNFGGSLTIDGVPIGRKMGRFYLKEAVDNIEKPELGSCMIVMATDAPLDARQLARLAKRAVLGLAAVGSPMTHGSGDYVIAFSTHPSGRTRYHSTDATESRLVLRDEKLSPLFQATREATEESIINSLFQATTTRGANGRISEAINIDQVVEICRQHGVVSASSDRASTDSSK